MKWLYAQCRTEESYFNYLDAERLTPGSSLVSANDAAARLRHSRGSSELDGFKRTEIEVEKRTKVRWSLTNEPGHVI